MIANKISTKNDETNPYKPPSISDADLASSNQRNPIAFLSKTVFSSLIVMVLNLILYTHLSRIGYNESDLFFSKDHFDCIELTFLTFNLPGIPASYIFRCLSEEPKDAGEWELHDEGRTLYQMIMSSCIWGGIATFGFNRLVRFVGKK